MLVNCLFYLVLRLSNFSAFYFSLNWLCLCVPMSLRLPAYNMHLKEQHTPNTFPSNDLQCESIFKPVVQENIVSYFYSTNGISQVFEITSFFIWRGALSQNGAELYSILYYTMVCLNIWFWLAARYALQLFNHRFILMCCFNWCTQIHTHLSNTHTHTHTHTQTHTHTHTHTHTEREREAGQRLHCAAHTQELGVSAAPWLSLI